MKFKKLQIGIMAWMMASAIVFSAPLKTFAEQESETIEADAEGAAAEGAVDENGNPVDENGNPVEAAPTESAPQGGVVMSGLPSNNGKVIASQFPEEYIPEGFHKSTCTYEGQTIEIAYMDNGNGEVVLAYLADADGSNGDFYLCDINTAEMSDFVQIYGGEGKYIIVLDPRDMVVAPAGFTKANLQWYGKSVSAWLLPGNGTGEEEEQKDEAKASVPALFEACAGAGRTMTVYAAGADGDEAGESGEDTADESQSAGASSEAEDGSGVVAADPSQYFMVYAINQDGVIGFYLYDTSEGTYQRYVQVDSGEGTTVDKYRSSAQNRLIVIAVLAVALVICLFVMINLILKQRDRDDYEDEDDEDDEDDEMEQMRRRVAKKEKSHIRTGRRELNYLLDMDDEDDEEDDEDDEDMEDEEPDWEHMQISMPEPRQNAGRRREEPAPVRAMERRPAARQTVSAPSPARTAPQRPASPQPVSKRPVSARPAAAKPTTSRKASRQKPDLDEDFEFEFLDI